MLAGIVGLPQAGKTTLFSILTGFVTEQGTSAREIHRGIAKLTDHRLTALAEVYKARKIVQATVEYIDIPGVPIRDGGTPEPYPPAYLTALKGVTMLVLVVRGFNNPSIPHPFGSVNPAKDLQHAELEFIFNDLSVIERRLEKLAKGRDAESRKEAEILTFCKESLENEIPLRNLTFNEDQEKIIRGFSFLSHKPLLVVLNVSAEDVPTAGEQLMSLQNVNAQSNLIEWVTVCAEIEAEIAALDPEERIPFLNDLGFTLPTLDRVVSATFRLLGMITFLTAGEKETRAWPVAAGATAVQAARVIHEDLARGFIRAEVCWWEDLVRVKGSEAQLRKEGKMRLEGKEYIVKDGDTLNIRFNV